MTEPIFPDLPVHVIGAGLAGSEATWQIVRRGIPVILHEMRPGTTSPAHKTEYFAELVCSNSFRAGNVENAVGLLKEEMRRLDSLIMKAADANQVPAGGALAVDRELFAKAVTTFIREHPLVTVVEEEVTEPENLEGIVIFASGPLTSPALSEAIQRIIKAEYLHFFDAAAPIVEGDSLNYDIIYRASRYDKGEAAYLNCPFYTKEEYLAFYEALKAAETAEIKDFEHNVFEGCMPIEEMAYRGEDTMRFGPLKPIVQSGRFSDPSEMAGTETGVPYDSRPGKCGICALRRDAQKYLPEFPATAECGFPAADKSPVLFCRTDDWGGRLCGIGSFRLNDRYSGCLCVERAASG